MKSTATLIYDSYRIQHLLLWNDAGESNKEFIVQYLLKIISQTEAGKIRVMIQWTAGGQEKNIWTLWKWIIMAHLVCTSIRKSSLCSRSSESKTLLLLSGRRGLQQFTGTFLNREFLSLSGFQSRKIINHNILWPPAHSGCTHGDPTGHSVPGFTDYKSYELHYCSQ